jgi:hypothetical protein
VDYISWLAHTITDANHRLVVQMNAKFASSECRRFLLAITLLFLCHGHSSGQLSDDSRAKLQAALEEKPVLWGVIDTESPVVWWNNAPDDAVDAAFESLEGEPLSVVIGSLEFLLTPQEGKFAPLRLIERLIGMHNPAGVDWPPDQLITLNEAFVGYTAYHAKPLAHQPDTNLQTYLALLTEHLHDHEIINFQSEGNREFATHLSRNDSPTGFAITRHALLQSVGKAGDALLSPSDYVGAGEHLYFLMPKVIEGAANADVKPVTEVRTLDLASGRFDRLVWKPAPIENSTVDGIQAFGRRLVLDNGVEMSVIDLDTRSAWTASLPGGGLYGHAAIVGGQFTFAWAAPPHYFGAIERDKELAQNPDFLAKLKSAIYAWDLHSGKESPPITEAGVPFLGAGDYEFTSVFGLENRRLVTAVTQRWARGVPLQQLYVSKPDSLNDYEALATMPPDWVALPWQGHPNEVLLLSERLTSNGIPALDAPQPERAFAINVQSRQLRLLWGADARQTLLRKWRTKPFKEPGKPQWELPPGISPPPPGEKLEWEHIVSHAGDIIALCARTRVGSQLTPNYELLVFRERLPFAVRIPIRFVQDLESQAFLEKLHSEGVVNPVRFDHLDARPIVTSNHLAFSSWYGVWWMSWDEVNELIRKAMNNQGE